MGGASLAPGNTEAAFAAGLAAGVDMVEFDVLRGPDGGLWLAHDPDDLAARPDALSLERGLAHLAGPGYAGVELDVDLKTTGYELEVLDALRAHGLVGRVIVSSAHRESLRALRAAEPSLRLGLSYPALRRDPRDRRLTHALALLAAAVGRLVVPFVFPRRIARGEADALMIHWILLTPRLLRAVRAAGGEVYVWTVDEPERVRALTALGVDGIITNDPRLFTP
jgi:glycerophosphoryl diester phosphodiesterase